MLLKKEENQHQWFFWNPVGQVHTCAFLNMLATYLWDMDWYMVQYVEDFLKKALTLKFSKSVVEFWF